MNKIILIIWFVCVMLLVIVFGNKDNEKKFIKYLEDNIERTRQKKKDNENLKKKFPLYQLIIYYMYIFIVLIIFLFGSFLIGEILVAFKEYLYIPEDSIIVYNSGIEFLCFFAGMFIIAPFIALFDFIVNHGFLLEIDRQKMRFSAKNDGILINIVMPLFCVVITAPLLFVGLNHYTYCTSEKIVIKTLFTKEKVYDYDDISYVLKHEYNVDIDASPEEKEERFDYKVFFKDGKSYKVSDSTLFEKEIVKKRNIYMKLDD